MDYVRLGNTGLKVSRLCLGCMTYGSSKWRSWVLDEEQSLPFFKAAIEKGINFFDTADVYSQGESTTTRGLGRTVSSLRPADAATATCMGRIRVPAVSRVSPATASPPAYRTLPPAAAGR